MVEEGAGALDIFARKAARTAVFANIYTGRVIR